MPRSSIDLDMAPGMMRRLHLMSDLVSHSIAGHISCGLVTNYSQVRRLTVPRFPTKPLNLDSSHARIASGPRNVVP